MKHASIVPLIGGSTIAQTNVFLSKPEYILSYSPFKDNDQHILNYYKDTPYYLIDNNENYKLPYVDVIGTICPCAGLSSLSSSSCANNPKNDWMIKTAAYVLQVLKPKVFWGENSPRLASKLGELTVNKMRLLADKLGYTLTIYKTKSILHGLSQIRDRTFYFFWKDNEVPIFEYFDRPHELIENTIINSPKYHSDEMYKIITNTQLPTNNPFYRYILEVLEDGISHTEYANKIQKNTNVLHEIEERHISYYDVATWMKAEGYLKEADKCIRMQDKLNKGGNLMRKTTEIPKNYIGAFVGHLPIYITHPNENRYLSIRECLSIMTMPDDFNLLNPIKNINHICQNVPVTTAMDMVYMIEKWLDGKLQKENKNYLIQDNKKKEIKL